MLMGGGALPGPFFLPPAGGPPGAGPCEGRRTFLSVTPCSIEADGLLTCAPPGDGGPGGGVFAPGAGPSEGRLVFLSFTPWSMFAEGLLT